MHIVYLHGFNSSPLSLKAGETAAWLAAHAPDIQFHCPRLSPHPAEALSQAETLLLALPPNTLLIGSSLGGFYATCLAERHGRPAALINPAVRPDRDLARFAGKQTNPYTGEVYTLGDDDLQALLAQRVDQPSAGRYWLLLGSRDEVLDWREAACH
ncbi:YqiA/YcfP family alpha/beta fold hydrolase, partial [Chromobacterium alticapitis]